MYREICNPDDIPTLLVVPSSLCRIYIIYIGTRHYYLAFSTSSTSLY